MKKILIGGSPCTKWSIANKNRETVSSGEGWELFKNYCIAKELFAPDYYFYENNVSASKEIKEQIEKELGNKRIEINSSVVSPQNRKRFYVQNIIDNIGEISSNSMTIKDIIEENADGITYKMTNIKKNPKVSPFGLKCIGYCGSNSQGNRVYSINHKGPTLCASSGGKGAKTGLYEINGKIRGLTVREAARCQTIPEWFQLPCSDNQSLKQIGNGWTCKVIELFFKELPKNEEYLVLSMFDGISCGQIVFSELGYNINKYIAVEIDEKCRETTKINFPNTIFFNNAFDVRNENSELYKYLISL